VLNTERPPSWPNLGRFWPSAGRSIGRTPEMRCFSRSATRHTDTPHGVVFDTQFRRYRGRNNQVEPLPIGAIAARGTLPTHTSPSSGAIAARQRAARCAPADRWRWRWHVLVAAHEHVVLTRLKPPFSNALFAFFQPFLTLFPHTPTPLLYAHTSRSTHPGGWGRGRRRRVGEARFATAGFAIAVSRPLVSRPLLFATAGYSYLISSAPRVGLRK
jgi:hypothetical protein